VISSIAADSTAAEARSRAASGQERRGKSLLVI